MPGPPGPKCQKKSQKGRLGPVGPKCQKVAKKSKKSQKKGLSRDFLETFYRLFIDFLGAFVALRGRKKQ